MCWTCALGRSGDLTRLEELKIFQGRNGMQSKLDLVILQAALAMVMALTFASATTANPYFAGHTNKDCADCHLPGRENEGRSGLNPMGASFLRTFDVCGKNMQCTLTSWAVPAAAPPAANYPAAPPSYPTATSGYPPPQANYPAPSPSNVPPSNYAPPSTYPTSSSYAAPGAVSPSLPEADVGGQLGLLARPTDPFRYFDTSPEVIRLMVMYVRFLLLLRNVETYCSSAASISATRQCGCVEPVRPDVRCDIRRERVDQVREFTHSLLHLRRV